MGLQIIFTEESESEEEERKELRSGQSDPGSMKPELSWYNPNGLSLPDLVMASFTSTYKSSLRDSLQKLYSSFIFIITDPRIQDNPIIYASEGFLEMTKYSLEEVLGRNCRFLQGPLTGRRTVLEISDGIREERSFQVSCVNYNKEGKAFWSLMDMAPLFSKEDGRVVHFVGVFIPFLVNTRRTSGHGVSQGFQCFWSMDADVKLTVGNEVKKRSSSPPLDENECEEGRQADKDKARLLMKSLLKEIASKCKGEGVAETRCIAVPAVIERVICSSLMLSLTKIQQSFVLVNPHLPNLPILHASNNFLQLSGYTLEEVIGYNCRFMQGPDTDPRAVQMIRDSLKAEKSCTVKLLNYRKDKSSFWNLLHISPIRNNAGKIVFFVGVQLDVTYLGNRQLFEACLAPDIRQLGVVGAVKVAVRGLQGEGLRRRMHTSE